MLRVVSLCLLWLPTGALADGYGFMTPTGNIYCNGAVIYSEIMCTIVERSGPPAQPEPASCTETWGHTFKLSAAGPATMSCARSPEAVDFYPIAPYGETGVFGSITCQSETTGLTCRNASGHGFFLSRRQQAVF